jgi:hypothetical protein
MAYFSSGSWRPTWAGLSDAVLDLDVAANGDLFAVGRFVSIGDVAARFVARFDGRAWSPVGAGLDGGEVRVVLPLPSGDLLVGGTFDHAGGSPAHHVARWDGSSWSPLGAGPTLEVNALAVLPDGRVVAGGQGRRPINHLEVWDGSTWSPFSPDVRARAAVRDLQVLPNGDLVACGAFSVGAGNAVATVVRWDGSNWSPVGVSGPDGTVYDLAVDADGALLIGGTFSVIDSMSIRGVARWDGASWSGFGSGILGIVRSVVALPDGDVFAIGSLSTAAGVPNSGIARWGGTDWVPVEEVPSSARFSRGALLSNGDLAVSSDVNLGGLAYARLDRFAPTCPAQVSQRPTVCPVPGVGVALSALDLPWIGSEMRVVAAGVPVTSTNLIVWGLNTTVIPLDTFLPQAAPGCDLLLTPEVVSVAPRVFDTARTSLAIPDLRELVGGVLHGQMVTVDQGPGGGVTADGVTNALILTIGALGS